MAEAIEIEKVHQFGGTVVACSDSGGYVLDERGIDLELLRDRNAHRRQVPAGPMVRRAPVRTGVIRVSGSCRTAGDDASQRR